MRVGKNSGVDQLAFVIQNIPSVGVVIPASVGVCNGDADAVSSVTCGSYLDIYYFGLVRYDGVICCSQKDCRCETREQDSFQGLCVWYF